MTKTKSTKRALLLSALSLLMCVSMLIGSTFAWFTDSVTSAGNIIKSGTLDVTMEWKDATATGAQQTYKDASEGAIFNYDLWEPGYVEAKNIKISNVGTLAFMYHLNIAATGEVSDLAKVIEVYYAEEALTLANRDLSQMKMIGTLDQILSGMPANANGKLYPVGNKDNLASDITVTIALKMQETAGNEYQGKSIGSEFAIELMATQLSYENDSFGNDYDKNAEFVYAANDEEFKNAVTADVEHIVLTLTDDITWDTAAWSNNPMGGESTKTITINGNGHTITFNNTNSDWTNIVTGDAVLTIKNATVTNSGYNASSGTWNGHDITFKNEVVLENVTLLNAVALMDDATLTNVTLTDDATGDAYGIWIRPNGQTVNIDGLNMDMTTSGGDDRGIKIDNQYSEDNDKGVTLNVKNATFKTEKKAAILVKSTGIVNIALENVNISGVVADPINAVWIDEATASYANSTTVTGGAKAVEGSTDVSTIKTVANDTELAEALADSDVEVIYLKSGNYGVVDARVNRKLIIAAASGATVKLAGVNGQSNNNETDVTINGITIDNSLQTEGWYTGTSQNMKPCVGVWGGNYTFEDCVFYVTGEKGAETGVMSWWTTEEDTFSFNRCIFNGGNDSARAMQIYGQYNLNVENCTFNTAKDYSIKYVGASGTTATFKNNTVTATTNFVQTGSATYAGDAYVLKFDGNTLADGINHVYVDNAENQNITVNGTAVEAIKGNIY